jgi:uncharacterized membrane protein
MLKSMSWVILTLLNAITNGTAIFLIKLSTKKKNSDYASIMYFALLYALLAFSPLIIYKFLNHQMILANTSGIPYLFLGMLSSIAAYFFYIKAIALNELSVFGPLENLRPFFVVLFSLLILQQLPTLLQLTGIFLIVLGGIMINLKKGNYKIRNVNKGIIYVITATALFGLGSIFDKNALKSFDPIVYAFFILLSVTIFYGVIYFKKQKKFLAKNVFSVYPIATGVLLMIGYITIYSAIQIATPNLVIPVQMTRAIYLTLLGFVFLKEKDYAKKILAAFIMLIGVILITH